MCDREYELRDTLFLTVFKINLVVLPRKSFSDDDMMSLSTAAIFDGMAISEIPYRKRNLLSSS